MLTNKIPGEKKNILHVLPMENEKHALLVSLLKTDLTFTVVN